MAKVIATVDDDVKDKAAALYESLGMSLSTAINVFLRQSVSEHGMPFRPSLDDTDGYPTLGHYEARRFPRSKSGRLVLPADWDDPADEVYDN